MITPHSDDPDVEAAAHEAAAIVRRVLKNLKPAETFDYGGHRLKLSDYGLCTYCTSAIAEAQAAQSLLEHAARSIVDPTVKEHVGLAAEYFRLEAATAEVRAELHNGQGSEAIINEALAFVHDRHIHDSYGHSHHGKKK